MRWILSVFILFVASQCFAQGACPSGLPTGLTGNHCYFFSAGGADTNNCTTEATSCQHAPGMPTCPNTCGTIQTALGSVGSVIGGTGFIFKGGDTWHQGNSGATPYTGGTWNWSWSGTSASCLWESTQTGCVYIGVDQTWFTGGSWTRPILTGDNATSTTQLAGACTYKIGSNNQMFNISANANTWVDFDNFEVTGLCSNDSNSNALFDAMLVDGGNGSDNPNYFSNDYIHGWTIGSSTGTSGLVCTVFGMGNNSAEWFDHIVIDGSDSGAGFCAWGTFPSWVHFKDSMIRYASQGVGQQCHDIHDNIFEHFSNPWVPTHGNVLECNADAALSSPNVFYNNIVRHDNANLHSQGQVTWWFCPNGTAAEYWFNNLQYDIETNSNDWAIAGPGTYSCNNQAGQFMFNNTLVGSVQPCNLGPNTTGGQYLTVYNDHLIDTSYDSAGTGCTGGSLSATNVSMSYATADSQGYTSGSAGTIQADTCANDTTPCGPALNTNGTVGTGGNHQAYCTTLASYSSDISIGTDAANACKNGTTDGCTYNATSHTMSCPAQSAVSRPSSAAWDSGAYEFQQTIFPGAAFGSGIGIGKNIGAD